MNNHFPNLTAAAQLEQDMLRPAHAVNQDGGFELGWGTGMLWFSLISYLSHTWFMMRLSWLVFLAPILAPLLIPKAIKRFISWPRTGYVAYRYNRTSLIIGLAVGALVTLGISVFLAPWEVAEMRQEMRQSARYQQQLSNLVNQALPQGRSYLGIRMQPVSSNLAQVYNLPVSGGGVVVESIIPGGAAQKAGIKQGDAIVAVNAQSVTDPEDLRRRIAATPLGTEVNARLLRVDGDQKPMEYIIPVVLGALPPAARLPVPPAVSPVTLFGLPFKPHHLAVAAGLLFVGAVVGIYVWGRTVKKQFLGRSITTPAAEGGGPSPGIITDRKFWWTFWRVVMTLLAIPLITFGMVFGLACVSRMSIRSEPLSFSRLGMLTVLVASNALLYAMANGALFQKYRWKWLLLVVMVLAPLGTSMTVAGQGWVELSKPVILTASLVWLVSGLATLVAYLRHTSPPSLETAP
jgi:membrane-associated protease RseP (regulator of RpoE activity)